MYMIFSLSIVYIHVFLLYKIFATASERRCRVTCRTSIFFQSQLSLWNLNKLQIKTKYWGTPPYGYWLVRSLHFGPSKSSLRKKRAMKELSWGLSVLVERTTNKTTEKLTPALITMSCYIWGILTKIELLRELSHYRQKPLIQIFVVAGDRVNEVPL